MFSSNKLWQLALLMIIALVGCHKPTAFDGEFLDNVQMRTQDSLTISFKTVSEDGFPTVFLTTTPGVLFGQLNDPYGGGLNAAAYLEFGLTNERTRFGTGIKRPDSLILELPIVSYGKKESRLRLAVQALAENFDRTKVFNPDNPTALYKNTDSLRSLPTLLNIQPILHVKRTFVEQKLRIPLSLDLAQTILNTDTSLLDNREAFIKQVFRGLKISGQVESPGDVGAIHRIDPARAVLNLHYTLIQDLPGSVPRAITYTFFASTRSQYFHSLIRQPSTGTPFNLAQIPDAELVTVQSNTNTYIRGKVNYNGVLDGKAINSATLTLKVDTTAMGSDTALLPPKRLDIVFLQPDGLTPSILKVDNDGAFYNPKDKTYTFSLKELMQELALGNIHRNGFAILADNRLSIDLVERAYLHTNFVGSHRPKFNIIYTIPPR